MHDRELARPVMPWSHDYQEGDRLLLTRRLHGVAVGAVVVVEQAGPAMLYVVAGGARGKGFAVHHSDLARP